MNEYGPFFGGALRRMLGAAKLDPDAFAEIGNDDTATPQAVFVVVLIGMIAGVPLLFVIAAAWAFPVGVARELINWLVWAGVTYLVAIRLVGEDGVRSSWSSTLRVAGFAQTPGLLVLFALLSESGILIVWAALGWRVTAMVVATRTTFGFTSNMRPTVAALSGFFVILVPTVIDSMVAGSNQPAA